MGRQFLILRGMVMGAEVLRMEISICLASGRQTLLGMCAVAGKYRLPLTAMRHQSSR